jgi:hypothetical protein
VSVACDQVDGMYTCSSKIPSHASCWSIMVCGVVAVILQITPVHSFIDPSHSWPSCSGLTPAHHYDIFQQSCLNHATWDRVEISSPRISLFFAENRPDFRNRLDTVGLQVRPWRRRACQTCPPAFLVHLVQGLFSWLDEFEFVRHCPI